MVTSEQVNPGMEEETTITFPGIETLKGKRLGEFRIIREIGRGSMGIVFEALQENLDRRVAIKILPPGINLPEKSILRFLREAESVAKLQHENIVQIYAVSKKGALHFYAMQYVDGQALDEILKEEPPLSFERIAHMMRQTAVAIDYAHRFGIIHRDIKPGNILVTAGYKIVITDFGLARQERGATLTESGALVGTPIYMSPEQIHGRKGGVGRSSDIYSIGVTLYELLTGEPPFKGTNTQEILNNILEQEPKPPRKIRSEIPWELEVIALKAMEKEPGRRFASAQDLAADLQRYLDGEPIQARPSGVVTKFIKKIKKHRLASVLATAAVILLLIILINTSRTRDERAKVNAYERAVSQGQLILSDGNQNNDHQAIDAFKEAVALFPDKVEAHLLLGQAYFTIDDKEGALRECAKAVSLDRSNVTALLELSRVQLRHDNIKIIQNGLENLMAVREFAPEDFSIAYDCTELLFQVYSETENVLDDDERKEILDKARQAGDQALKFGKNADMLCLQGMILYAMARHYPDRGGIRNEFITLSLQKIEEATVIDKNHRMAFELKREIESSRGGRYLANLYKFVRDEGLGEWAISQGTQLVGPAWSFLKDEFLPTFETSPPPEESPPPVEGEPDA